MSELGIFDGVTAPEGRGGLWYPRDYILPCFAVWRLSNYTTFPNGKPYDAQSTRLLDDFIRLNRRLGYWVQQLKPKWQ